MSDKNLSSPRSIEELQMAISVGSEFKYLYFWGHKGTGVGAHVLSQWYPVKFYENKRLFKLAEHYMMFRKAQLFSDYTIADEILTADDPGKVKSLGRRIAHFDEKQWMNNRFEIVVEGNLLKFKENPNLLEYLLQSNPRVLVEASPRDKIWGIGIDAITAKSSDPFSWKGLNLLGFALMEARSRLLATAT